jgi:hypothetical protein
MFAQSWRTLAIRQYLWPRTISCTARHEALLSTCLAQMKSWIVFVAFS